MARVEPRTFALDQLIEQVRDGYLRVPKFQRQFVWRYKQVRELFESIAQSYPIGTLLIWSTSDRYRSFDTLGSIPLAADHPPEPTAVGYLLDGHQRVSTIVGCLSLTDGEAEALSGQMLAFRLYYDLDEEEFVHDRAPKEQHLPVRYLLGKSDTMTAWFDARRDDTEPGSPQRARWDRNRRRAFALQTTFSQYRLPYLEVTKADLAEAVRIFVLLNTAGSGAKKHEVFAALSWQPDSFDFGQAARDLLEQYADFGNFGPTPILSALLSSLGESAYEDDWQSVQERHRDRLEGAFADVASAFGEAVEFVRERLGVESGKVLPYALYLVLLTEFFRLCPKPSEAQADHLERWLWASSFSLAYSAATNVTVDDALERMRAVARGELVDLLDEPVEYTPTPATYHPKSARVRTTFLFLKQHRPRDLETGEPLENLLADGMADGKSIAGPTRSNWPIAGRILYPRRRRKEVWWRLTRLFRHPQRDEILASHLIPLEAFFKLNEGDEDAFLRLREAELVRAERAFANRYVSVPTDGPQVDPEPLIDVEDEEASDLL